MIGIVVVSHSAALAEGVVALARGMAGDDVPIEAAGGIDEPGALGTDAVKVMAAIEAAGADGALVLMDLGSAVLSAETALDFLDDDTRARVLLCEAPLVEGAVAAAAAARAGASLEEAAAEARNGLAGKVAHLGGAAPAAAPAAAADDDGGGWESAEATVAGAHGLHARPAAAVVRAAADAEAEVRIRNLSTGAGPAPARSLTALGVLGAREGHRVRVEARGPGAAETAAAIAALIGTDEDGAPPPAPAPAAATAPADGTRLEGVGAAPGRALGPARLVGGAAGAPAAEPSGDPAAERAALDAALGAVAEDLAAIRGTAAPETADILEAQSLALADSELVGAAQAAIDGGRSAARAWHDAVEAAAAAYDGLGDEYLRARAADLRDLGRRVVTRLAGGARDDGGAPAVLVAEDLGAAEVAELDRARVRALATAAGGPTSHASIIARGLGIPAVAGLGPSVLAIPAGTMLIVDGGAGTVDVGPDAEAVAAHEARARDDAAREAAARERSGEPAVTADGRHVEVAANIGGPGDVDAAVASGADGVGLLRSEFLFLDRAEPPSEDEQTAAYEAAVRAFGGRRVVVRTLDAGADKPLRYMTSAAEANPFLGVRGLRLALAHPDALRAQLRAVLRAASAGPIGIMFPMVSEVDELRRARAALDEARASLADEGVEVAAVEVGAMVEVPAAAVMAEELAAEADFLSIGTNDLTQYVMAAERGNAGVARLSDPVHPAVLRLIDRVARAGQAGGARVAVCGEAASDPAAVPLLVGVGVGELSVAPRRVPLVKAQVRGLDTDAARALADRAMGLEGASEVRALVAREAPPA
ncbi:MAG: phosphoenolpyruvate--protein phosphotransferase [Thermoleophilia bacterium]